MTWHKVRGAWAAKCKGKRLGYYATEEAAAQAMARAYDNYAKDGLGHAMSRAGASTSTSTSTATATSHLKGVTSQFKGVTWHKVRGTWRAVCKHKHLGYYATVRRCILNR